MIILIQYKQVLWQLIVFNWVRYVQY